MSTLELGSGPKGPPAGCRYSGYCAWRGVVRDSEAPEAAAAARRAYPELGSALYFELSEQRTHAVLYELPGQRLNWLWCGPQTARALARLAYAAGHHGLHRLWRRGSQIVSAQVARLLRQS